MSLRAACRLETLGFEQFFDYLPGKVDWLARGLPTEGEAAGETRASQLVRDDAVTCLLDTPMGSIRESVAASPYGFAFVTTEHGILLGRLRRAAVEDDPAARAEAVMELGPSTVRADTSAAELVDRMRRRDLATLVVTDPEGRLLGVVRRADAEAAVGRMAIATASRPIDPDPHR